MNLELEETWPPHLIVFLNERLAILMKDAQYEEEDTKRNSYPKNSLPTALMDSNPYFEQRELAASKILELLQTTTLLGWHCTRLTQSEITHIIQSGLQLPNLALLENRINQLQVDGLITKSIANRLKAENQANDQNRKDRIWFCFYPPQYAGKSGIIPFFQHWGGEALYNLHKNDSITGKVLREIGKPCLIEANVPISALNPISFLGNIIIRRYLVNRGLKTKEPITYEGAALKPIMKAAISKLILYGDTEFIDLTGCDQWTPSL